MKEKKNEKENQKLLDNIDYLSCSASVSDCTGLIPSLPQNEAERESYKAVYPYQPKADSKHGDNK